MCVRLLLGGRLASLVLGILVVLPMLLHNMLGFATGVNWCSAAVAGGDHPHARGSGLAALPDAAAGCTDPKHPLGTLGRAH